MRVAALFLFVTLGLPLSAGPFSADVVVLGELHDNPYHHVRQAEIVADLKPRALVFEMLTRDQALAHLPGGDEAALAQAFDWANSGWPDFAMYYPIFSSAPDALVLGAGVPRSTARAAMKDGLIAAFGNGAEAYGLTVPLDEAERKAREALQMAAHCNALPNDILPAMVDIQRLRDAELARTTLRAFELTGGPMVVITGNGHARSDWGMPAYLKHAAPDLTIVALGQGEGAIAPEGTFDVVEMTAGVERADPCEAFQSQD